MLWRSRVVGLSHLMDGTFENLDWEITEADEKKIESWAVPLLKLRRE